MPLQKPLPPNAPFVSHRAETQEQWAARMAGEALAVTRSSLYLDFRFLGLALNALAPAPDPRCRGLATDGEALFFAPAWFVRTWQANEKFIARAYLHAVFHCVFRHLWLCGPRDPVLWGLACDIAVENVIDGLGKKSVQRPLTYVRRRAYEGIAAAGGVVAAAPAYRWLLGQSTGVQKQLWREFTVDDHCLWPKPQRPDTPAAPLPQAAKTWEKLGRQLQTELEARDREAGSGPAALTETVRAANRSRTGYREFLRRFCVLREEVHLDPDTFDLNFYTYGLSLYGNLPLVEPNETREAKKVEELALIIDTSYSTSGELVRAFLTETYTLLKAQDSFFRRMNLHLIQADDRVQTDLCIQSEDDLVRAMNAFTLAGGGGTDFRPALRYVQTLCEQKVFRNLRGVLYFTDGLGVYPKKRPPFDTAFLFLGDRFDDADVPPWAIKVVLDESEFAPPGQAARASALAEALAGADEPEDALRELNNT